MKVTLSDGSEGLLEWVNERNKSLLYVQNDGKHATEIPVWNLSQYGRDMSPTYVPCYLAYELFQGIL